MVDIATLDRGMLLYLKPIPGYREPLREEFAALSRSVWKDEHKTRCHYWLYPEDNENEIRLLDLYNDQEGMEHHATSDLAFVTFRRIEQFGVSLDLDELARRRRGLPALTPRRVFKPEGIEIDYLQPLHSIPGFMGTAKIDEKQLVTIAYVTGQPDKMAEVTDCLTKLAERAQKAGALAFWVNQDLNANHKLRVITRFSSDRAGDKFYKDSKVRDIQAQLSALGEVKMERCHWAKQGFFQKP